VQRSDGSWAALLLGTRPRGRSPGFHVLGRETFFAPVEWVDGWPRLGPIEVDDDDARSLSVEHFDALELDPQWVSVRARPAASWSLRERPGSPDG
jgi:xylan 1,4-beta-xylosidase